MKKVTSYFFIVAICSLLAAPVKAMPHDKQTVATLQTQLAARPEYAALLAQFNQLTPTRTHATTQQASRPTRRALIACLNTIEKLEETYPSELLNQVASWCYTQLKKTNRTNKWIRNGLIIGGSALALAAAIYLGRLAYVSTPSQLVPFLKPSYTEQPLNKFNTEAPPSADYDDPQWAVRSRLTIPAVNPDFLDVALAYQLSLLASNSQQEDHATGATRAQEIAGLKELLQAKTIQEAAAQNAHFSTYVKFNKAAQHAYVKYLDALRYLAKAQRDIQAAQHDSVDQTDIETQRATQQDIIRIRTQELATAKQELITTIRIARLYSLFT
jgi:hypothetical protein